MPLVLIMLLGKLGEWGKFPRFLRCWRCLLMGQILKNGGKFKKWGQIWRISAGFVAPCRFNAALGRFCFLSSFGGGGYGIKKPAGSSRLWDKRKAPRGGLFLPNFDNLRLFV